MTYMRFALVVAAFISLATHAHTATVDAQGGTADNGNPTYPKITADDLVACKTEITKLHQLEISFLQNETRTDCASGKRPAMCKHSTEWLNASSGTRDIDWFVKGNDSCSGSDYPCYGLSLYNDEEPNEGMIRGMAEASYKGNNFWDYSFVVDHCVAKIWVAKMDGNQTPLEGTAPASSLPSPVSGGNPKSASQDSPVTAAPAAPAGSTPTADRTLAELGALTGKSSQEALHMLTPVLTAAIGGNPNIVKALAGLDALNANSIQEALAILKPLLTDAAKKNPSAAKALAGLNALTADAPEDAVAVLITILTGSASKDPTVAKTLASLEALPANTATVHAQGGTAGNGNPTYPKITADDLVLCKTEITKLHQMEIIFLKNNAHTYCASGKQANLENCKHATDWLNGSAGKRDIDWFVEGNTSCSDGDDPCYGLGLYNDEKPNEGMIRDLSLDTYKLPTSFEGRNWGNYAFVVDHCVAKIWVAKMDRAQGVPR